MNLVEDFKNALKGPNKICDPLLIYIIMGIFQFVMLYMIYNHALKEKFAPINLSNKCKHCNGNSKDCKYCKGMNNNNNNNNNNNKDLLKPNKRDLLIAINIMFYLYIIFGIFLYLLCRNNMKNAAWFIILYPFISRLVWALII